MYISLYLEQIYAFKMNTLKAIRLSGSKKSQELDPDAHKLIG